MRRSAASCVAPVLAQVLAPILMLALLAACSSGPPPRTTPDTGPDRASARVEGDSVTGIVRPGAYYKDDGPGENPPPNLDSIADAEPRPEPLHRFANNPYQIFGRDYVPLREAGGFRQRGSGSWYGRRFHGQRTSSGEPYDMYAMTAAHPTLPIPSYARVTNPANGRSVVVRVNDRGPFHAGRVIDLSFAAAYRLGYARTGSAQVEVEGIAPAGPVLAQAAPVPVVAQAAEPPPDIVALFAQDASRLPVATDERGVYLQLGAFSMRDNAESFRAKVYRELDWLSNSISVLATDGLFRLHLGPYRTQEEARRTAERIRSELSLQPVLVVR